MEGACSRVFEGGARAKEMRGMGEQGARSLRRTSRATILLPHIIVSRSAARLLPFAIGTQSRDANARFTRRRRRPEGRGREAQCQGVGDVMRGPKVRERAQSGDP